MFVAHFRQTSDVWKIVPDAPPFLDLGGQTFLFPDLTFSNGSQTVHLELFHKWHEGQLKDRLAFLAEHPDFEPAPFAYNGNEVYEIQTYPADGDCDGTFCARLRRKDG